jgi:hypothetical protein
LIRYKILGNIVAKIINIEFLWQKIKVHAF